MTSNPKLLAAFRDFVEHLQPGHSVVDQWAAYVEQLRNDTNWSTAELAAFGSHLRKLLTNRVGGCEANWFRADDDPFAGEGFRVTPIGI